MELNYFGNIKMIQSIGALMMKRKKGRICLVGSVCSFMSIPGMSGYQASKYAQKALADTIKHECEANGVRVHLFTPSTIDTPGLVEENKQKPAVTWEIEG